MKWSLRIINYSVHFDVFFFNLLCDLSSFTDADYIFIDKVIKDNPKSVTDYKMGKNKAINFLKLDPRYNSV